MNGLDATMGIYQGLDQSTKEILAPGESTRRSLPYGEDLEFDAFSGTDRWTWVVRSYGTSYRWTVRPDGAIAEKIPE